MSDRSKIGPRVDTDLWERFREDVRERKGQTRGVLGDELENAIRQYLGGASELTDEKLDARLQRIEAAVGAAATDGGDPREDAIEHTHAPSRLDVDERPAPNAATDKKVAYLAQYIREQYGQDGEIEELPQSVIVDAVKDEYGFRSDTAKRYVERLVEHFDMVEDPTADGVFVTPDRREEILERRRERIREETEVNA